MKIKTVASSRPIYKKIDGVKTKIDTKYHRKVIVETITTHDDNVSRETLHISGGNIKVDATILSVSSGTNCVNRLTCPYSKYNTSVSRETSITCYAQKCDDIHPSVKTCYDANEQFLNSNVSRETSVMDTVIETIERVNLRNGYKKKILRLNESGDLSNTNIDFLEYVVSRLVDKGWRVYSYTHSSANLQARIEAAGATIMESDIDFVIVKDVAEAKLKGITVCPAQTHGLKCGSQCNRCAKKLITGVLGH